MINAMVGMRISAMTKILMLSQNALNTESVVSVLASASLIAVHEKKS